MDASLLKKILDRRECLSPSTYALHCPALAKVAGQQAGLANLCAHKGEEDRIWMPAEPGGRTG